MCGRYVNVASDEDLLDEFDADAVVGETLAPSWNIAPTDPVRIVVNRPAKRSVTGHASDTQTSEEPRFERQVRTARWGLVPGWSRDRAGAARMINARIETVAVKAAFKSAAARRRCIVPALGYYEWQARDSAKVPYFLHDHRESLLGMAGLYELWRDPALPDDDPNRWLWTCTIITQQATDLMGEIHDRTPVAVPHELISAWLDCTSDDAAIAKDLLALMPALQLEPRLVSPAVGNVRNNGPELIEGVSPGPTVQPLFDFSPSTQGRKG